MDYTFVFDKEDNKLTSAKINLNRTFDFSEAVDVTEEEINEYLEREAASLCDDYEDEEGYKGCKSDYADSSVSSEIEVDINNLEAGTDGAIETGASLEEIREYFEDSGIESMTCKVK